MLWKYAVNICIVQALLQTENLNIKRCEFLTEGILKGAWVVKLSVNTALTDYWNMSVETAYSALRCKVGLFLSLLIERSNTDKKSYVLRKARKIPRITAYQKKHQKIIVENKHTSAAKLSFFLSWIAGLIPNIAFIINWWRRLVGNALLSSWNAVSPFLPSPPQIPIPTPLF